MIRSRRSRRNERGMDDEAMGRGPGRIQIMRRSRGGGRKEIGQRQRGVTQSGAKIMTVTTPLPTCS